jgi:hypothetical protein
MQLCFIQSRIGYLAYCQIISIRSLVADCKSFHLPEFPIWCLWPLIFVSSLYHHYPVSIDRVADRHYLSGLWQIDWMNFCNEPMTIMDSHFWEISYCYNLHFTIYSCQFRGFEVWSQLKLLASVRSSLLVLYRYYIFIKSVYFLIWSSDIYSSIVCLFLNYYCKIKYNTIYGNVGLTIVIYGI